jgi:hypothetical protein
MSHQPEHEVLQAPENICQSLLTDQEESQQAMFELSDEQLESATGGSWKSFWRHAKHDMAVAAPIAVPIALDLLL